MHCPHDYFFLLVRCGLNKGEFIKAGLGSMSIASVIVANNEFCIPTFREDVDQDFLRVKWWHHY